MENEERALDDATEGRYNEISNLMRQNKIKYVFVYLVFFEDFLTRASFPLNLDFGKSLTSAKIPDRRMKSC